MSAKLVAYEHVPSGFEIVITNKDIEMGKIWNLWWNVQLTDDPEAWDEEIKTINNTQRRLDDIPQDLRLIRAQMAEFCRASPLFPESVNILCDEIGFGRLSIPWRLGCEGRNLLESLGYHDAESMRKQRIHMLKQYAQALERWLSQKTPLNAVHAKISGFLGDVTEPRELFVKGILSRLESEELPLPVIKDMCERECRKMMGDSFNTRARPLHCLDCTGGRTSEDGFPDCLCSQGTLIDVGILCIRANNDCTSILREYRRFAQEYVLAYTFAVNSWLEESTAESVTTLTCCRYITEETAKQIPAKVHASLGKRDDPKMWLAACLLKTLKSNQRWHKRTELIDNFPEATSYLRETQEEKSIDRSCRAI